MNQKKFLLKIVICANLFTSNLFAGIYQVVVLQSADGRQCVRLYFDMHTLGTITQNQKQFDIIAQSIKNFSTTGKHLDILVESPDLYRPLEQDWAYVLGEGEQPKNVQAITKKTLEAQKQEYERHGMLAQPHYKETIKDVWSHQSSIFYPIPYLIGEQINPENSDYKNIRITSIDPRNILNDLQFFVKNNILLPYMVGRSLKDVFDNTLEQARSTILTTDFTHATTINIPIQKQKTAATTLQAAIRGHLARTEPEKSQKYRQKIKTQYKKFEEELTLFMQIFEKKIGKQAWTRIFEKDKNFEETFTPEQQKIIQRYVKNAISSQFTSLVEYDLLTHIVEPGSAKEIAVFAGGSHAQKIIPILTKLDYRVIYQKGYTSEFIDLYFDKEKVDASKSAYSEIDYYPPEAITTINIALTETLTPNIIPHTIDIDAPITTVLTPDDLRNAVFNFDFTTIKHILIQSPNSNILVNSKIQLGTNKPTNTPLHIATILAQKPENKNQAIETIKILLMFGANPNLMNSDGKSVFDITSDPEVIEILNTQDINKKYFDLPAEEVVTELTKLINSAHISFLQAQLKLRDSQNFEQEIENSLITLSQLHYLISKLELNTEAKQDLKIALTELEIACMRAQQKESLSVDTLLTKIGVLQVALP